MSANRPVPPWASLWVQLHPMEADRMGNKAAGILLPAELAHQANAARYRIVHDTVMGRETRSLYAQALMPPPLVQDDEAETAAPISPLKFVPPAMPALAPAPAPAAVPAPSAAPPRRSRGTNPPGVRVRILSDEALARYGAHVEMTGKRKASPEARGDKELAAKIVAKGGLRTVILRRSAVVGLQQLREDMPNFAEVIAHVELCVRLALATRTPLHIGPMLLVGLPGGGKTRFAMRLAAVLGAPECVYALESAETTSRLTGSDKYWANTEPGELFNLIVLGEAANPVVVLDELDKAPTSNNYPPAKALHAVLEPVTAKVLRDKSADLCFDASHVIYVATANRLSAVEGSLLSRFKLFHIPPPDARAAVAIARSVARVVFDELRLARRFGPIEGEVLQQLALIGSARLQGQVLRAAIGRALLDGRWALRTSDLGAQEPTLGGGHVH